MFFLFLAETDEKNSDGACKIVRTEGFRQKKAGEREGNKRKRKRGPNMNRKAAGMMIGTASTLCALMGSMMYMSTKILVNTALDRNAPAVMSRFGRLISGTPKNETAETGREAAGMALLNKNTETVRIRSRDGTSLTGHFYPCAHAKRTIVAMHGWRSVWYRDFGAIADFWHDAGCNILFPDQRGQNESGGNYIGFGALERHDCALWAEWAEKRCGKLPVYLVGISMGATTVLLAAGLPLPACVKGIIADCGFVSTERIWRHVIQKNLHMLYGLRRRFASALCRKKLQLGTEDISTVHALQQAHTPVMLIHGTADRFVPVEMTYENFSACAAPKRLLIVPGAGHGMSYVLDRENYEREVRSFWEAYDV